MNQHSKRFLILTALAPVVLLFQNCSPTSPSFSEKSNSYQSTSGNGDGYGGKITVFNHFDAESPCAEVDAQSDSLPNNTIHVAGTKVAEVVRESCQDIAPRQLAADKYKIQSDSVLVYAGLDFLRDTPTPLKSVNALCPTGMQAIASGAKRQNLFDSSFDLSLPPWGTLDGMKVSKLENIGGLPGNLIERSLDATMNQYFRTDQFVGLDPDRRYAVSFLVKEGTDNVLRLQMYDSIPSIIDAVFTWNITTGQLTSSLPSDLLSIESAVQPFASGSLITLYFTTPAAIRGLDIGVSSGDFLLGSSIIVAEAQLEAVDTFCEL